MKKNEYRWKTERPTFYDFNRFFEFHIILLAIFLPRFLGSMHEKMNIDGSLNVLLSRINARPGGFG